MNLIVPGDGEPAFAACESVAAVERLTAGTMRRQVGRFPAVPQGDGVAERTLVQGEPVFLKGSEREPR